MDASMCVMGAVLIQDGIAIEYNIELFSGPRKTFHLMIKSYIQYTRPSSIGEYIFR